MNHETRFLLGVFIALLISFLFPGTFFEIFLGALGAYLIFQGIRGITIKKLIIVGFPGIPDSPINGRKAIFFGALYLLLGIIILSAAILSFT
jgi:hypothetical protein